MQIYWPNNIMTQVDKTIQTLITWQDIEFLLTKVDENESKKLYLSEEVEALVVSRDIDEQMVEISMNSSQNSHFVQSKGWEDANTTGTLTLSVFAGKNIYNYKSQKRFCKKTTSTDIADIDRSGNDIKGTKKLSNNVHCIHCTKRFSNKKGLKTHMWIHKRDKNFVCQNCGKNFLRGFELVLHERIHSGYRPFSCGTCGKSFTNGSGLKRHKEIHNKDRNHNNHNCSVCGKMFSLKGNLTAHMKIHTDSKDHACEFCNKSFLTKGSLKRHLRFHSKERPYKCDFCDKSFGTSNSLIYHRRLHTGERPYLCAICGTTFKSVSHLKQHLKTHDQEHVSSQHKKKVKYDSNGQRST